MNEKRQKRPSSVLGFIIILAAYSAALMAGNEITVIIYRFTGRPPEPLTHVFSGIAALLLLILLISMTMLLRRRKIQEEHQNVHSRITDVLEQIARGNFDVLLDTRDRDVHHDFAEAINDMAKKLGSLETMRQDFISNVSHEIQSPLTSISGFAALLKKDDLSNEERHRYADIIEAESKRLSSLSSNLLKLSSLDNNKIPLNKREFRLDKQLKAVALMLEPQWSVKNITMEADLMKCYLLGDEDLLSQAWVNLLHNAIKFTPEGGQISITSSSEGKTAVVKIADTGVGIKPEDQIHIFERFYKADKARDRSLGGNGLGLSLVKKIVELHDGRVTVESEIGRGTTFSVYLPHIYSERQG